MTNHELCTFEPLTIVDLGTRPLLHTHRVDEELHAEVLDAGIAFLNLLVELESVLQAGAAAALHENAQHQVRVSFAANEIPHLPCGRIREQERRGFKNGFSGSHMMA